MNYPFWVSVEKGLNRESAATKRLNALVLPWVSSVSTLEKLPEGVAVTTLATTTDAAFQNKEPFNLNPFKRDRPKMKKEDLKQYSLVLMAEGEFPSAYKGEKIPEAEPKPDTEQGPPPPTRGTTENDRKDKSSKTSILLIPNSLFVRDQYLQSTRSEDNLLFMENTIDSLVLGQDLIGIRTRGSAQKPLNQDLTDSQKTSYKWLTIIGVPILVILFGFLRIPWVRSRRRYYETILVKE